MSPRPNAPARAAAALIATGLMAAGTGCATVFESRVTTFHTLSAEPADRTYVFAPSATQKESLEYRSYEQGLRGALTARGFREATPARYRVSFDWSAQQGARNVSRLAPVYAPSFSLGYGFGGFRGGFGGFGMGIGGFPHPYGFGGFPAYVNVNQVERFTEHAIRLQIEDTQGQAATRVWEGTAVADTELSDMAAAFPLLTQALLTDFPGPSGQTRRVRIELPRR